MNNSIVLKSLVLGFVTFFVAIAMFFIMSVSYNNSDVRMRNALKAKEDAREAVFDETWKTIKQIAQVSDKYSDDFAKIYPALMQGRYGNARGGALLSFITEANPNFDNTLYIKLANVIEQKRSEFTSVQKQLIDLKREHDNLLDTFPGSFFIRNREKITIVIISSERTKNVISTGQDNDVNVFDK